MCECVWPLQDLGPLERNTVFYVRACVSAVWLFLVSSCLVHDTIIHIFILSFTTTTTLRTIGFSLSWNALRCVKVCFVWNLPRCRDRNSGWSVFIQFSFRRGRSIDQSVSSVVLLNQHKDDSTPKRTHTHTHSVWMSASGEKEEADDESLEKRGSEKRPYCALIFWDGFEKRHPSHLEQFINRCLSFNFSHQAKPLATTARWHSRLLGADQGLRGFFGLRTAQNPHT